MQSSTCSHMWDGKFSKGGRDQVTISSTTQLHTTHSHFLWSLCRWRILKSSKGHAQRWLSTETSLDVVAAWRWSHLEEERKRNEGKTRGAAQPKRADGLSDMRLDWPTFLFKSWILFLLFRVESENAFEHMWSLLGFVQVDGGVYHFLFHWNWRICPVFGNFSPWIPRNCLLPFFSSIVSINCLDVQDFGAAKNITNNLAKNWSDCF